MLAKGHSGQHSNVCVFRGSCEVGRWQAQNAEACMVSGCTVMMPRSWREPTAHSVPASKPEGLSSRGPDLSRRHPVQHLQGREGKIAVTREPSDTARYWSRDSRPEHYSHPKLLGWGLGELEIPPSLAVPRKPQASHFILPGLSSSEPGCDKKGHPRASGALCLLPQLL